MVSAAGTVVTYHRPAYGWVHIGLSGREDGALTSVFFGLLEKEFAFDQRRWPRNPSQPDLELFVDANRVSRHGLMFESWIRFLVEHRQRLRQIHILATNPVSRLSVEIIQHLSGADALIRLHDDAEVFNRLLREMPSNAKPRTRYLDDTVRRIRGYMDDFPGGTFPGQWHK